MDSTNADCPINFPGLWHNGDCSLLCRPTKSYDILIFFLGNYLAHVATVVSPPGASIASQILNLMGALLLPFSGICLGFEAIASLAIRAPTPLTTAARSGALLMIVETKKAGESVPESSSQHVPDSEVVQQEEPKECTCTDPEQNTKNALPSRPYRPWTEQKIHGNICLPKGYEFKSVPYYTEFESDEEEVRCKHKENDKTSKWYDFLCGFGKRNRTTNDVACSYNGAKAIVSIVQTVFGIYTLVRTRGNQIERFGYAAYGLTVAPYALMSIVNLLGNLLRLDYPSLYIVGSNSSATLQDKYGCTIATVGRIKGGFIEPNRDKDKKMKRRVAWVQFLGFSAIITINLLVLGIMTKFTKGQSTLAQRVWTMCWLACGAVYGLTVHFMRQSGFDSTPYMRMPTSLEDKKRHQTTKASQADQPKRVPRSAFRAPRQLGRVNERLYQRSDVQWVISREIQNVLYGAFVILIYGVPTIGGFVVVAQMIRHYGVCSKMIDDSV